MRLPETSFKEDTRRDLLVSNFLHRSLEALEPLRHQSEDFAARRFATAVKFTASKKKFDSKELQMTYESLSRDVITGHSKNYPLIRAGLYFPQDQRVCEHIFNGLSSDQVLLEERMSFDDYLKSLKRIEAVTKEVVKPKSKLKPFSFFKAGDEQKLSDKRLRAIKLHACGYNVAEIAEVTNRNRKLISSDLRNGLAAINLARDRFDKELQEQETLNLTNKTRVFFNRLFSLLPEETQTQVLEHTENNLDKAYLFVNRFLVFLSDNQRKVLRRRLWGVKEVDLAKRLEHKSTKVTSSLYKEARVQLARSVGSFFKTKASIPEGLDPIRFMTLTAHESFAVKNYIKGKTKAELKTMMGVSSIKDIDRFIRNARRRLRVDQAQIDKLRQANVDSSKDPNKALILLVYPELEDKYNKLKDPEALVEFINISKLALAEEGFETKYFDQHLEGKKYFEIAQQNSVSARVVSKSINRLIRRIREAYSSTTRYPVLPGLRNGRWFILDEDNKAIYTLHRQGKSNQEIVDELGLQIKASSVYPRLDRIMKGCKV